MRTHTNKTNTKSPSRKSKSKPAQITAKINIDDSWQTKTLEQLAAEQHIKPVTDWDSIFGMARDLWKSDEEFEQFLRDVRRPFAERV